MCVIFKYLLMRHVTSQCIGVAGVAEVEALIH
jgi:hypothetical protein